MKIPKNTRSKLPFIVTGVLLVLLLIGGAYWWVNRHNTNQQVPTDSSRPENTVNYDPPTEEEKKEGQAIKKDAIDRNQNPPTTQNLSVTINKVQQIEQNVLVRSIVSGTSTGTCDLTFVMAGQQNVTKSIPISTEPTAMVCNTDVPASDFPASGEWTLSVIAKNGTSSSPTATQKVTVTK